MLMGAAERAKRLNACAGDLTECDGLGNLFAFAVEQIKEAEQAARLDERIQIDKPLVAEAVLDSILDKETQLTDPREQRNERAMDATAEIKRLHLSLVDERRKVLEEAARIAEKTPLRSPVAKQRDKIAAAIRALAEEVT